MMHDAVSQSAAVSCAHRRSASLIARPAQVRSKPRTLTWDDADTLTSRSQIDCSCWRRRRALNAWNLLLHSDPHIIRTSAWRLTAAAAYAHLICTLSTATPRTVGVFEIFCRRVFFQYSPQLFFFECHSSILAGLILTATFTSLPFPYLCIISMGVDHGGRGRQVPPEFGAGDCPPRFCHVAKLHQITCITM